MTQAKPNAKRMRQLVALTQRKEYQTWLEEESQSTALLVHGRSQPTPVFSPLSYLCARIAEEYAGKRSIVVLSYFCGAHARNGQASAADLLCRMIGQLLSWKEAAAVYARDPLERNWEKKLKKKDFDTLLDVFARLVRQLRKCKMVIFCLVDSISKIECVKQQRRDTECLLRELNELVRRQRSRSRSKKEDDCMVFKLMVTDGAMSLVAHRFFRSLYTINMIGGGFGNAVGGLKI